MVSKTIAITGAKKEQKFPEQEQVQWIYHQQCSFEQRQTLLKWQVCYPSMWAKPSASNTIFVSDSYLKYAKPYAVKTIGDL